MNDITKLWIRIGSSDLAAAICVLIILGTFDAKSTEVIKTFIAILALVGWFFTTMIHSCCIANLVYPGKTGDKKFFLGAPVILIGTLIITVSGSLQYNCAASFPYLFSLGIAAKIMWYHWLTFYPKPQE